MKGGYGGNLVPPVPMKIEQRIIFSNIFNLTFIVLIGVFAFQNLTTVLTKLRFVEIADDLNTSFLEMRLSEKNFFLYHDQEALADIKENIEKTLRSMEPVKEDIIRAVGENNFKTLETYLRDYSNVIDEMRSGRRTLELEMMLRARGKRLKGFSEELIHLERRKVNEIILNSKKMLFYSFWVILIGAIIVSHMVSQRILRSLRKIEQVSVAISRGNFTTVEGNGSNDELGAAINAINLMSEELKNREEQIIQSKKLASIGILTAGIAHELINPINNISMITQTYGEIYRNMSDAERLEFMNRISGEVERMRDIVRNLLDFARPKEPNLRPADINEVIGKSLRLTGNALSVSNIDLRLELNEGLPPLNIDEAQIQQVLVNLITNAIQAMPGGGILLISTGYGKETSTVEIRITDSGKGIPPEFLPHIFDPFFTTKEGGTGLGLSVSYSIIKKHKGDIRVDSRPGEGTTFTIELPVSKET